MRGPACRLAVGHQRFGPFLDLADQIGNLAKAEERVRDDDTRNQLLLGIAGVAIAAALGIACQKRLSDTLAANQ